MLVDIRAFGSDGVVLLKLLRAYDIWRALPVIMLIDQDVSPEELLARIRKVLHLQACQDKRHQLEMLLSKANTPDKLPVLQAMSSPVLINQKTYSGTCG
jgi:hypothetical protein